MSLLVNPLAISSSPALRRSHSGQYVTGRGGEGSFQTQFEQSLGQGERQVTWQNQHGVGTVTTEWQRDRQEGTFIRQREVTLANGGQAQSIIQRQRSLDGSYTISGSRTGVDGQAITMNREVAPGGDGSVRVSSRYALGNGQTVQTDKTIVKTDDGRSADGSYATGSASGGSFQSSVSHAGDGLNRHTSITSETGKTASREVDWSRDGNTLNRRITTIGPDGQSHSYEGSITFAS